MGYELEDRIVGGDPEDDFDAVVVVVSGDVEDDDDDETDAVDEAFEDPIGRDVDDALEGLLLLLL